MTVTLERQEAFEHARFAVRLEREVAEWTANFEVAGHQVSEFVEHLEVIVDGVGRRAWVGGGRQLTTSAAAPDVVAVATDPWHPAWADAQAAIVTVTGRWLHINETRAGLDPYALARHYSALYVACREHTDPDGPRRYDPQAEPDRDPIVEDLGVIAFPITPGSVLAHIEAGLDPHDAGVAATVETVVAAAVHESFEMHQVAPGQPHLDPHQPHLPVSTMLTYAGGRTIEIAGTC